MKWYLVFLPILLTAPVAFQPATPTNIVLIVADDLSMAELAYMPQTQALLGGQGVTFENFFVTQGLCCPSRASILRGQYPHNHGIWTNNNGFEQFRDTGLEASTLATWLDDAGYRTGLIGKYLNGYKAGDVTHVPPGWDDWVAKCGGHYFTFTLCANGQIVNGVDYETDELADRARVFMSGSEPYFLLIAPSASHTDGNNNPAPATRDLGTFEGIQVPRDEAFNEADVSDKPGWIQNKPRLTLAQTNKLDKLFQARVETAQALDDMIASLITELEASGRLTHTLIVFTSDNGFHLGQHRLLKGKNTAYNTDVKVPLIMRGLNITPGLVITQVVGNIDLAPTFAELGQASLPAFVDGRSLVPLLANSSSLFPQGASLRRVGPMGPLEARARGLWRGGLLLERFPEGTAPKRFHAIQTDCQVYIRYANGASERYLMTDTLQVNSLTGDGGLTSWLESLQTCTGEECRVAENEVDICH